MILILEIIANVNSLHLLYMKMDFLRRREEESPKVGMNKEHHSLTSIPTVPPPSHPYIPASNRLRLVSAAAAAKLLQSCPTLCNPRDGSPPGCPIPGILQARTLEWVAIAFSNA